MSIMSIITSLINDDLYNNQYDYETLKSNIYAVSLIDILKTQKLTKEFCINFILNDTFWLTKEEENITIELVNELQPHLNINKMDLLFRTDDFYFDA